jgi:hypothetical protein
VRLRLWPWLVADAEAEAEAVDAVLFALLSSAFFRS